MNTQMIWLTVLAFGPVVASAQLAVNVCPVRITGSKTVVPLRMKNEFAETIESARAACFLLDDNGKVVAHATRWVIGGNKTIGLPAGTTNSFYFVIGGEQPFTTTNLTAKVSFTRLVLEGGRMADPSTQVTTTPSAK